MKSGRPENMIIAGLDQDYAEAVRVYEGLTPRQRGDLADWIVGNRGNVRRAPQVILEQMRALASIGFLEVGHRWANQREEK